MDIFNMFSGRKSKRTQIVTNKTKKKAFKRMNCSPAIDGNAALSSTCFTKDILMKIRDEYNGSHPIKIESNDPKIVWEQLREKLVHCEKEDCWLKEIKNDTLRKQLDEYIFAPDSPPEWDTNPNEWLSNYDILKVLTQYQHKYKKFRVLGPSPIDFDTKLKEKNCKCVEEDICQFSLTKSLHAKKTKIGMIFNLDKHDESGSHWVSLFIDIENRTIFYFDSAGDSVPHEIDLLVKRIQIEGKHMKPALKMKYYDNDGIIHQHGNTECGMYSLFFNITMLEHTWPKLRQDHVIDKKNLRTMNLKDKIRLFKTGRISDKYIEHFRHIYFNHT